MADSTNDLKVLSDEEFRTLQASLEAEITRRRAISSIKEQITPAAKDFVEWGGTKAEFSAIVDPIFEPKEENTEAEPEEETSQESESEPEGTGTPVNPLTV